MKTTSKNDKNHKNKDDLKNKDNLKNKDDLKNEDDHPPVTSVSKLSDGHYT